MTLTAVATEKQFILSEVQRILLEITAELNDISPQAKKQIANTVYFLGNNLQLESNTNTGYGVKDTRIFAFVIKKSFWKNKMTLELRSANYLASPKFDDYKNYINKESLEIFDIESLVIIKHFLLSFAS